MSNDPSFGEIFSLCLHSKCPVCGRGRLFSKMTSLRGARDLFLPLEHCEVCHFRFGRQPGYYLGVITPILPILALVTGAIFSGITYFGFHQEIETVLAWGAVGVGIGFAGFFRTAVAVYVAIDHAIDPPKRVEH